MFQEKFSSRESICPKSPKFSPVSSPLSVPELKETQTPSEPTFSGKSILIAQKKQLPSFYNRNQLFNIPEGNEESISNKEAPLESISKKKISSTILDRLDDDLLDIVHSLAKNDNIQNTNPKASFREYVSNKDNKNNMKCCIIL